MKPAVKWRSSERGAARMGAFSSARIANRRLENRRSLKLTYRFIHTQWSEGT